MDNNNLNNSQNTNSQNQNNYQNNYQQPQYQQPQYQQAQYQQPQQGNLEEPISVGEWLITMLICAVPCLNIVMIFIWAFGNSEKKSKSNYFKAMLIVAAISLALSILMMAVFGSVLFNLF